MTDLHPIMQVGGLVFMGIGFLFLAASLFAIRHARNLLQQAREQHDATDALLDELEKSND